MSRRQAVVLLTPSLLVLLLFFVVPVLTVLNNSFLEKEGGFTLGNYASFLTDSYYVGILYVTFKIAFVSTVITLLIGYVVAYYVTRVIKGRVWKRIAYIVIVSPLFTSAVVRSFGWMVILGNNGFLNNLLMSIGVIEKPVKLLYNETGIIIGMVYILAPFMILSLTSVLQNIDPKLEEAAMDLGCGRWETFWRVTLPLSLPGVLSGATMVFSLALSAYVTPALMSGGKVKVLAMLIYEQMLQVFNWPFGAAISFIMLAASLLILALNNYLLRVKWAEEEND